MASQLSSLAAPAGLCLLSALATALLVLTLYVLGVVASFAVFWAREFARRDPDRPPLMGTVFRQLKNFDRLFDEHVKYALAHRTCRLVYPAHNELFTADPAVVEHVLKTSFSKYSKVIYAISHRLLSWAILQNLEFQDIVVAASRRLEQVAKDIFTRAYGWRSSLRIECH